MLSLFICALLVAGCTDVNGTDSEPTPQPAPQPADGDMIYDSRSAVALAPTGEWIDFDDVYPDAGQRNDAHAGIFYFVWQGAHGYDVGRNDGKIVPPTSTDEYSPYDISILERGISDPQAVNYGPGGAMHYWGKPYFDYYVGNDPWVIRKHAAMLTDAGIDVIFIDVTNGFAYVETVKTLCDTYLDIRKKGNPTPQISFITANAEAPRVVGELYSALYTKKDYLDLWYEWDGKPLMLAPDFNYGALDSYFTFRYAWFDSVGHGGWFGDGVGKWTWGDYYPQALANGEQMSVSAATHANTNHGRSYIANESRGGAQPASVTTQMSGAGTLFKKQFDRAIDQDPEFIFITGWNEWVAQRQINDVAGRYFLGKPMALNDTYFVDCYNHEFSRDIEPMEGGESGFGDNYYYYMVDYLRRYKGMKRIAPDAEYREIAIDGSFDDWAAVKTWYRDDEGDTAHRDHFGFGWRNRILKNLTGRNDILWSKMATDGENIYFYVQTAQNISPHTDPRWMQLLISVSGLDAPSWEGFHFIVGNARDSSTATLSSAQGGGWKWFAAGDVSYRVADRELEMAMPLSLLGITSPGNFTVDFKWVDNSIAGGDIMECMRDGDSAPEGRFRYRYIFGKASTP